MEKLHGSAYHLGEYRRRYPVALDSAILTSLRQLGGSVHWLYPEGTRALEPQGIDFIGANDPRIGRWRTFWPQTGRQQSWDGVARVDLTGAGSDWVLIEAKANHPEFCGAPTRAREQSLAKIETALGEVKHHLGVHRHFCWTGSYYQFANRLAALHFLRREGIAAHCVFVYFVGDSFPDGRECPGTESEWRHLLEARDLTLGLKPVHALSPYVHSIFLPATVPAAGGETLSLAQWQAIWRVRVNTRDFMECVRAMAPSLKHPRRPKIRVTLEDGQLQFQAGDSRSSTLATGVWSSPILIDARVFLRLTTVDRPQDDMTDLTFEDGRLTFGSYSLISRVES